MRNESRKSGSGRGGEKPVAEKRYGACRLLLHFFAHKGRTRSTETAATRQIFAFTTSRALSASSTTIF